MPWQGNDDNLIDRFDVRAHLDWIPEAPDTIDVDIALTSEDRHINYERYRIIVQNEFLGGSDLDDKNHYMAKVHSFILRICYSNGRKVFAPNSLGRTIWLFNKDRLGKR